MLKLTATAGAARDVECDLLVVPVLKGGIEGPGAAEVLADLGIAKLPVTPDFRGDIGEHLLLSAPGIACGGLLVVGLGRMDAVTPEQLRRAAAVAAAAASGVRSIATTLAAVHPSRASIEAIGEGLLLGSHVDRRFRSSDAQPSSRLRDAAVLVPSSRVSEAGLALRTARVYAGATIAARELVNLPPNAKTPQLLAEAIGDLAGSCCDVTVLGAEELAAQGYGGVLAVGRGSANPPRLVELRYRPAKPMGHVALVGKGITFDSGGLSLKSSQQMRDMKSDMAGAAAVAAVCSALSDIGVRLDVTAFLPLAENLPGSDAQRPDDVITHHGGITVEVRDTDAEGRLLLADALHAASELEPDAIVDVATLTGTAISALGRYAAPIMSTDEDLLSSLRTAAEVAGESLWPLPLWEDLEEFLRSPVADLRNVGDDARTDPGGHAITAALFLRRFVGEVPWAHLDIAGPAFLAPELARHHMPAGGTGFGVRTLLAWLERRTA
jgi:leucyl aminopeptidase